MIEEVFLYTEIDNARRANPRAKNNELIMGQYAGVDSSVIGDKLTEEARCYALREAVSGGGR